MKLPLLIIAAVILFFLSIWVLARWSQHTRGKRITKRSYIFTSLLQGTVLGGIWFLVYCLAGKHYFGFWSVDGLATLPKYGLSLAWSIISFFAAITGVDLISGRSPLTTRLTHRNSQVTPMQTLKLADDLFPGVLDHSKQMTLRKGFRDIRPGLMQLESVSGALPTVIVGVREVRFKRLRDLTLEEARADGFETLDEVIPSMRRFYQDINADSEITLVFFSPIAA